MPARPAEAGPALGGLRRRAALAVALALLPLGATPAPAQASPAPDAATRPCGGYPRLAGVQAPAGWCVAQVLGPADGLRMPRRVLAVAPGRLWLVDMGGWDPHRGRLLQIDGLGAAGARPRIEVLAQGLDRPHGLARGPDGLIYLGEAGQIWRSAATDPAGAPARSPLPRQTVLAGLPADGAHPLKELLFTRDGRLLFNVGSFSDACRRADGGVARPCAETTGPRPRGAVWQLPAAGWQRPGSVAPQVLATGLRNSLGLAELPGAAGRPPSLWQAENSVDLPQADRPAEELNRLSPGSDHGWPHCLSDARGRAWPTPGAAPGTVCPAAVAPAQAWPAHVAPLQLLWVPPDAPRAAGTPPLPWAGRLLAVWHGYRRGGHRVVALRPGPQGESWSGPQPLLTGWEAGPATAGSPARPVGAPTGVALDPRGWLWLVDDRHRQLLLVAPDDRP